MKFYVTFGQRSAARDGVVEVEAPSEIDVRLYANANTDGELANWCSVHSADEWNDADLRAYYPQGVLRSFSIGPQRGVHV